MLCGAGFFFNFTAFNTLHNLTALIYDQLGYNNLGYYLLAIIYITLAGFSFVAPSLVHRFSARKCLPICVIGYMYFILFNPYSLYNASFIAPAYCYQDDDTTSAFCSKGFIYTTAMIGALTTGIGGATLWVAQGAYVAECAIENNTEYYQGLFWGVFMLWAVVGNGLAFFILQNKDSFGLFFVIMVAISLVGFVVFSFLQKPERKEGEIEEEEERLPILTEVTKKAKETFLMLGNKRMIPVLFLQFYRGIVLSYYSGVLAVLTMKQRHDNPDDKVEKARLAASIMIFFGVAEVLGAITAGRLIKAFGKRFGIYLLVVLGVTACVGMLSLVYNKVHFGWPYYIEAALWGLADSSLNTSIIGLLSSEFEEKEAALGILGITTSVVNFLGYFVSSYLLFYTRNRSFKDDEPYIMITIVLVILASGYIGSLFFKFNEEQNNKNSLLKSTKEDIN